MVNISGLHAPQPQKLQVLMILLDACRVLAHCSHTAMTPQSPVHSAIAHYSHTAITSRSPLHSAIARCSHTAMTPQSPVHYTIAHCNHAAIISQSPVHSAIAHCNHTAITPPPCPAPPTCRSVCSWLLMRTSLWPVWAAKYPTKEVLPLEVGPCSKMGCFLCNAQEGPIRAAIDLWFVRQQQQQQTG
eukprot:1161675-Pelagomonas_calceolata.AAC.6